jgi:hypothetical protein
MEEWPRKVACKGLGMHKSLLRLVAMLGCSLARLSQKEKAKTKVCTTF